MGNKNHLDKASIISKECLVNKSLKDTSKVLFILKDNRSLQGKES